MTGFEIYLLIYWVANAMAALFYIANGGYEAGPGVLFISFVWTVVNIILLLTIGIN
jgi:hypothetical protein